MSSGGEYDVLIVGNGVAGLSAGMFTARQGLSTAVLGEGDSMLCKNSHLENYPGFPGGVNPRLLLDMLNDQAEANGCEFHETLINDADRHPEGGFVLSSMGSNKFAYRADFLIGATGGDVGFLRNLEVEIVEEQHGAYVGCDARGRTSLEGLYVAGGLANKPLQAVISAGHGAEVALTVLEDSEVDFVHDWSVPKGFFTDRGREVPPGCEEVDEDQRSQRETRSREQIQQYFESPHPGSPTSPPGVKAQ